MIFVDFIAVESLDTQKKTFTKWINVRLNRSGQPMIVNLFEDLRDGTQLLSLLALLTGHILVITILSSLTETSSPGMLYQCCVNIGHSSLVKFRD